MRVEYSCLLNDNSLYHFVIGVNIYLQFSEGCQNELYLFLTLQSIPLHFDLINAHTGANIITKSI